MTPALLVLAVALAQQPATLPRPDGPDIADNSFLIEEAYNQEAGVVQHINVFARHWQTGQWAYNFTQEWPVPSYPRQQLSYTVVGVNGGSGGGVGDVGLNWRYQVPLAGRVAVAPRLSMTLPTGSADRSRGSGRPGLEVNLPISARFTQVVSHTNIGGAHTLGATSRGSTSSQLRAGQGLVFLPARRVNLLVETVVTRERFTGGGSRTMTTVSPGLRWAHDLGPAQIVPGLAVPIDLERHQRPTYRLIGYLSVEHPFGGRR